MAMSEMNDTLHYGRMLRLFSLLFVVDSWYGSDKTVPILFFLRSGQHFVSLYSRGKDESHVKKSGILIVKLRCVNHGLWSSLGC